MDKEQHGFGKADDLSLVLTDGVLLSLQPWRLLACHVSNLGKSSQVCGIPRQSLPQPTLQLSQTIAWVINKVIPRPTLRHHVLQPVGKHSRRV